MLAIELHKATLSISGVWKTWGAFAALIISVGATLGTISQGRMARKAFRLARQQDDRFRAQLSVELKEAIKWTPASEPYTYFGVRLLVINPADSQGALVGAELHVSYRTLNARLLTLKVPHDARGTALPMEMSLMTLPAGLSSNGALDGWFIFAIPDSVMERAEIESYLVTVHDSRDISRAVQPSVFRRIEI